MRERVSMRDRVINAAYVAAITVSLSSDGRVPPVHPDISPNSGIVSSQDLSSALLLPEVRPVSYTAEQLYEDILGDKVFVDMYETLEGGFARERLTKNPEGGLALYQTVYLSIERDMPDWINKNIQNTVGPCVILIITAKNPKGNPALNRREFVGLRKGQIPIEMNTFDQQGNPIGVENGAYEYPFGASINLLTYELSNVQSYTMYPPAMNPPKNR